MKRLLLLAAFAATPALALSPEAQEFLELTKKLEPVQCEKRKLRRDIAVADVERDDDKAKALRARFDALNRDKDTTRMEKRLAQLEPRLVDKEGRARRPEDLDAISLQRREAFYRCK
ncbi:MAG: hypothetical protein EXR31_00615 [Betaproteobacteria bacterium]|nr:hypothetical protein [Betaproteobacteria bacterium]